MRISVVIPTLNEAAYLGATLARLGRADGSSDFFEIICADGGSKDETIAIASHAGATVVHGARGRGAQLHAGACAATGEVLWFLHADTIACRNAAAQIDRALADSRVIGGNFRLHFDGRSGGARFLNALYPRLAWLGLRYGDSGIFVRRSAYERAGGFRPHPIFEDLDLLRRLRRLGRLTTLPGPLCTSSRRFESRPFAPVFARWTALQVLYWAGCDPVRLGRWYYPEQQAGKRTAPS